jgi:hypothetical protein
MGRIALILWGLVLAVVGSARPASGGIEGVGLDGEIVDGRSAGGVVSLEIWEALEDAWFPLDMGPGIRADVHFLDPAGRRLGNAFEWIDGLGASRFESVRL